MPKESDVIYMYFGGRVKVSQLVSHKDASVVVAVVMGVSRPKLHTIWKAETVILCKTHTS